MDRLLLFAALFSGCNTDDGKISQTCDEIPLPCHWEAQEAPSDDSGQSDTGQ